MPLLKLETAVSLSDEKRKALLETLSALVAKTLGKPEQYVMATVSTVAILMSGQPGNAAFVEVRSIGGISSESNQKLSREICRVLEASLEVPSSLVYLNFSNIAPANWGWNNETFG